ncbi:MAG: hypothetical protein ABSD96_10500 [Candidatus Korobacteraceae bacterium]
MARKISNVIGALGFCVIGLVWYIFLNFPLELTFREQYWIIYRHVLPYGSVCFTLAAAIKGKRQFWIPASIACALAAMLFEGARDL